MLVTIQCRGKCWTRLIVLTLSVISLSVSSFAMTPTTLVPSYDVVGGQHPRRWSPSETRSRQTNEAGIRRASQRLQVSCITVLQYLFLITIVNLISQQQTYFVSQLTHVEWRQVYSECRRWVTRCPRVVQCTREYKTKQDVYTVCQKTLTFFHFTVFSTNVN